MEPIPISFFFLLKNQFKHQKSYLCISFPVLFFFLLFCGDKRCVRVRFFVKNPMLGMELDPVIMAHEEGERNYYLILFKWVCFS